MWTEVTFNVAYLVVVWGLVAVMARRRDRVAPGESALAGRIRWAFALLALGDTGHVGFRVLAYAQGDLAANFSLFGQELSLVGLGALSTAITVTFFYVLMLDAWRLHFNQKYGPFEYLLLAAAAARLAIMIPPANQWNSVVPPQPWSLYRNLPLLIQGLGLAYLVLRDARRAGDRAWNWIGVSILISYACYTPVILFVQQAPLVGMLMIPKTMAYVAIGLIAYRSLYAAPSTARRQETVAGQA
jgi:hypothetical protein